MGKLGYMLKDIYKDHLYRNSIYLILDSVIAAAFGFLFWIIAARLFTTAQVGYATTIISAIGLVASFSFLGLNTALIRYLPQSKNKSRLIGSCINLSGLVSIFIAFIFLVLVPVWSPKLMFVLDSPALFIMFIVYTLFWVLFTQVESVFISSRRSQIVLFKTIIFSVCKVLLPVLLVFLGAFGILSSYYIASLIGFIFTLFFFKYKFVIDFSLIKEMFVFSFGNYIAGIFIMLPTMILPIIITNHLGPEPTAYFYMALMIAGLLFVIPGSVSRALLSEGSHSTEDLSKKIKKAYLFNFLILTLGVIILLVIGKFILGLFKPEYVQAYPLLIFFSLSGFFLVINTIYGTVWNIKKQVKYVIIQNLIKAFFIIVPVLIFISNGSILLISKIWLGSEVIAAIFSVIKGMGK